MEDFTGHVNLSFPTFFPQKRITIGTECRKDLTNEATSFVSIHWLRPLIVVDG